MRILPEFFNKKISTPLGIIVILFFALLAGGFLFWQCQIMPGKEIKIPEIKRPEREAEGEIADWRTYRNEEYGFGIDYPNGWEFEDFGNLAYYLSPGCLNYSCREIIENDYECFSEEIYGLTFEKEIISISGAKGCQAIRFRGYPGEEVYIIFPLESVRDSYRRNVLILSYLSSPEYAPSQEEIETFNQIISTFRFLE